MNAPHRSGPLVQTSGFDSVRGSSDALFHTRPCSTSSTTRTSIRYSFLQPATEPGELGWLGHYRVLRTLGAGGMGYVFHAVDMTNDRHVALKVMKPDLDDTGHPELRFRQEARILTALAHEHLVTVSHVGEENGVVYLAMELLQGETLDRWLHRVRRAEAVEVMRIGREIATGLAFIHSQGLLHRDLKPSNLWRDAVTGRIKILDFGLAREIESDIRLTQSDRTVGTPGYLSPEQARGEPVDARSDLFSLGAVLYGLCTGTPPFCGTNTLAVLTNLTQVEPQPPHELNPGIPVPLSHFILRLLAKQAVDRPADAQAVVETLRRFEQGDLTMQPAPATSIPAKHATQRPPLPRKRLAWLAVAGLLGAIIAIVVACF